MKFRICRITDSFPPPWSGLNPGPYGLSVAQHELGNEVVVIAKQRQNYKDVDSSLPFQVVRTHAKKELFDFAAYYHFRTLHRRKPFDILHTHGSSFFWIQLLNKYIKIIDIPIVVSVHNIRDYQNSVYRSANMISLTERSLEKDMSCYRKEILRRFPEGIYYDGIKQRICYRNADLLLPVSKTLAKQLEKTIGAERDRIKILSNGVDLTFFSDTKSVDLSEYGITENDKVLLFVGRLLYTKDITSLILSMNYIKRPNVKLLIIGDGPWSYIYHKLVDKFELNKDVVFIRNVPHEQIPGYYKRCDIFVFTSFSEGLPKVVLEAMAAGKPILGADVEGVRDLVDEAKNGRLFKPNSPESIARKINDVLLNNNLAVSMGQESINIINNYYTWNKIAVQCQSYYEMITYRYFIMIFNTPSACGGVAAKKGSRACPGV